MAASRMASPQSELVRGYESLSGFIVFLEISLLLRFCNRHSADGDVKAFCLVDRDFTPRLAHRG